MTDPNDLRNITAAHFGASPDRCLSVARGPAAAEPAGIRYRCEIGGIDDMSDFHGAEIAADQGDELKAAHQLEFIPNRKRSDRRFIVDQPVRLSTPGAKPSVCEARLRDISRRGMRFAVERPIHGPCVRIEWSGRQILGAVRYQRREPDGYRLGVELSSFWESLVSDVLAQQVTQLEASNTALRDRVEILSRTGERLGAYADALAKKNEQMCDALDQARQASAMKSRFLASMSHELRTPLNGIIGFAQMLHDGALGPVTGLQTECLDDMLSCSDHLLLLIGRVLDLTMIESGKMTFQCQPVSLSSLIQEAIATLLPIAEAKRIAIEFRPHPHLDAVQADPGRLKQVLYNYLSNALKFTGDGGRIAVSVSAAGAESYRIDVEDSGVGIQADDLPRLFSEFGQLAPGGKSQVGSGLGLAITKRIAEAQGGRVGVTSELGKGSRFFVVLPRDPQTDSAT
jgi:signal transduction histidine kinase